MKLLSYLVRNNKMRKLVILFVLMMSMATFAQTSDEGRISIQAMMPDGMISVEASKNLVTRMQRMLVGNGYGDNGYVERFVLTAKVDVTSKDIVPSTPARVSEKMEVTFFVGDIVENKLYASCTVSLQGIGTNETKALISAFSKLNPNQKDFSEMLDTAKGKIVDFYTNHCAEEISKARTMASVGNYDEAISRMMAVPNVCADCYDKCQVAATSFYQQKIDAYGLQQLNKAHNAWMKSQDTDGANEVARYLNTISPHSSCYQDVEKLRKDVVSKLKTDELREWNFQQKQYEDSQDYKRSIVKACRDVGMAWANNQPQSIVKNIIRGWW